MQITRSNNFDSFGRRVSLLFVAVFIALSLFATFSVAAAGAQVSPSSLAKGINTNATKPVVLLHGMGDSCCFSFSMGRIYKLIQERLGTATVVYSIRIGNNVEEDVYHSYLSNANKYVDEICAYLRSNAALRAATELAGGSFNAIGFSQGGQFLRAFVYRCNDPPVYNLISIHGYHQGIFGLPQCPGVNHTLCEIARKLLDIGAMEPHIYSHLLQAAYFKDPLRYEYYLRSSIFLADINNERPGQLNETYRQNLESLNRLVLVMAKDDRMVQPRETSWFEFYSIGYDKLVEPLEESTLYREDRLGLRMLAEQDRLVRLATEGDHLRFSEEWFVKEIIERFLV